MTAQRAHELTPAPAAVPLPPSPAARRRNRPAGTRKGQTGYRLTNKVIEQYEVAVAGATPPHLVADYLGIPRHVMAEWLRTGRTHEHQPIHSLPQREKLCVQLLRKVRKAQGEAAMRVHGAIAKSAGLTREPPTIRTIRTVYDGATVDERGRVSGGTPGQTVVETRELPGDWRAAKALAEYRFPDEMGRGLPELEYEAADAEVTDDMIMARIREARAEALRRSEEQPPRAIEAESTDMTGYRAEE